MQDLDRPFRGRRLTWQQFYELRPDRRPANDNQAADNDNRTGVEGVSASRQTRQAVTGPIHQR